jgi:hypothetical protein
MPWTGFESTNAVFERAKTIHASHRAATMINEFEWIWGKHLWFCLILYPDFTMGQKETTEKLN